MRSNWLQKRAQTRHLVSHGPVGHAMVKLSLLGRQEPKQTSPNSPLLTGSVVASSRWSLKKRRVFRLNEFSTAIPLHHLVVYTNLSTCSQENDSEQDRAVPHFMCN